MVDMAFEGEFLHGCGILVVGLVDGALKGVLRHVAATSVLYEKTETRVAVGIGTTFTHGNRNLFQDVGILFGAPAMTA